MDRFSLIPSGPPGILDFLSLAAILSFTYSKPCYFTVIYVITLFVFVTTYVTYSTQTFYIHIYHSRSYSFAALILRLKKCLTMSSHAQTSRSHKSKNPTGHDEDSNEVALTPRCKNHYENRWV